MFSEFVVCLAGFWFRPQFPIQFPERAIKLMSGSFKNKSVYNKPTC